MTIGGDDSTAVPFPALCSDCGALFPFRHLLRTSGPGQVRIGGLDIHLLCPECGGDARVLDGSYVAANGLLDLVRAEGLSVLETKTVLEFLRRIQAGEPAEKIQKEAGADPKIGSALRKALTSPWASDLTKQLVIGLVLFGAQAWVDTSSDKDAGSTTIINNTTVIVQADEESNLPRELPSR